MRTDLQNTQTDVVDISQVTASLELAEQSYASVIDGIVAYIQAKNTTPAFVKKAETFLISTKDDLAEAAILRTRLSNLSTNLTSDVDPVIKLIRDGLDRIYEAKREALAPGQQADGWLKGRMEKWQAEERQKAREAEERARLEQEQARRHREEAERAARQAKTEQERLIAEADRKTAREQEERAKAVRVTAAAYTPVKVAGAKTTTKKGPMVEDVRAAMEGVVAGTVPEALFVVDEKFLAEMWKEDRGMVIGWAGVTVGEKTTVGRG